MISNLFLILALGVHDNFGKHLGQDILEQLGGELEAGPDMALFQDIQHVACDASPASTEGQDVTLTERGLTIELVLPVKVSIVEDLDGNLLLVVILCLEVRVIGGDEFFNVDRGDGDLFVLPLAIDAHESPISDSQGDTKNDDEEDVSLEPAMGDDGQDTFQHPRDTEDDCGQM